MSSQSNVTNEMVERFRSALLPGYIVWFDGRRLSPEDTRTQILRGLLAALKEEGSVDA